MGEFIVSSVLSDVQDARIQAAYMSAQLGLQVHHPDQVVRRRGGFGPKVCPHHPVDQRWDSTQHGCPARLRELKMILTLTVGRSALRQALVDQGLITWAEAYEDLKEGTSKHKRGHRRQTRWSRPSPRPASGSVPARAIGVARVAAS